MRTLNFTLKTDADIARILDLVVPHEAFSKFSELSPSEQDEIARIHSYTESGRMHYQEIVKRNLVATDDAFTLLRERAKFVAVIIWACTADTENYGFKLARAYVDRLADYWSILGNAAIRDIRWESAYEFFTPSLPASLRQKYPDADYEDHPWLISYNANDPAALQEEIDWYQRWYPRRHFCRQVFSILYN